MNHKFLSALFLFASSGLFGQAGSLDNSFNMDGKVITDFGYDEYAYAICVQPDMKILVAGFSYNAVTDNDYIVARYMPDGSLDESFGGGDGFVTTDFDGRNDRLTSMALQTDGKIVVTGSSYNGDFDIATVRYLSNGDLDESFDGDGKMITDTGGNHDEPQSVVVQPDGKILIGGTTNFELAFNDDFCIMRFNEDGTYDNSFDDDGIATTDFFTADDYIMAMTLAPDGRIIAGGKTQNGTYFDIAAAIFNSDGSLDESFGGDGKSFASLGFETDEGFGVAIQPDGKVLVGGFYYNGGNHDYAVVRFNTDGLLDNSFDTDGKVSTDLTGDYDEAFGILLQPDGKIVLAGSAYKPATDYDFGLTRYTETGSLDPEFSGDGKVLTAFGPSSDAAYAIALQPDGKIVVAGSTSDGSQNDFAIARYISGLDVDCVDYVAIQPVDIFAIIDDDIEFITASSDLTADYQWQTFAGGGWTSLIDGGQIEGSENDTLKITDITIANNGMMVRCLMNFPDCPDTSLSALLMVECAGLVATNPEDVSAFVSSDATFEASAIFAGSAYQWQINDDTGWTDVSDGGQYSGATTESLHVSSVNLSNNMDWFRCDIIYEGCLEFSDSAMLTVEEQSGLTIYSPMRVSVRPNPASDAIYFEYVSGETSQISVAIFDLVGHAVEGLKNAMVKISDKEYYYSLPHILNGIYVLEISDGKNCSVVQLIIQH